MGYAIPRVFRRRFAAAFGLGAISEVASNLNPSGEYERKLKRDQIEADEAERERQRRIRANKRYPRRP